MMPRLKALELLKIGSVRESWETHLLKKTHEIVFKA